MSKKLSVKPKVAVIYHDESEEIASKLFEGYLKNKNEPEQLLKASNEIIKSSNPEAKKISVFYKALYLRGKGLKEKDDKKARKDLLKSMTEFKKVLNDDDNILKRVELEFLKRKMGKHIRPEPKILFRRAKLYKELKQDDQYNLEMSLFYMFSLLDQIKSSSRERVIQTAELMLKHAKLSNNPGVQYKIESLYHQVKAQHVFSPKEVLEEHQKAVEAIKLTDDKFGLESAETEATMARAMTTIDEKKRNLLLKKVAKSYQERGLKRREEFVNKLISPIPLRPAKTIYLCDKSIEKLRKLEKTILGLKTHKGPAAILFATSFFDLFELFFSRFNTSPPIILFFL